MYGDLRVRQHRQRRPSVRLEIIMGSKVPSFVSKPVGNKERISLNSTVSTITLLVKWFSWHEMDIQERIPHFIWYSAYGKYGFDLQHRPGTSQLGHQARGSPNRHSKLTARNHYAPNEVSNPATAACRHGDSSELINLLAPELAFFF